MKISWFILTLGLICFSCTPSDSGETRKEYRARRGAFLDSLARAYPAQIMTTDTLLSYGAYTIDFENALMGNGKKPSIILCEIKDIRKEDGEYRLYLNAQQAFYTIWAVIKCQHSHIDKIIESPRNPWGEYAVIVKITKVYKPILKMDWDVDYLDEDLPYCYTVIEYSDDVILEGICIDLKEVPQRRE